jgi:peptidoglycan hydrolase-like protein with peptidoglycan-binding domain
MAQQWWTSVAVVGMTLVVAGPALAQTSGSGTSTPAPGAKPPQPSTTQPSTTQPSMPPSPGTTMPSKTGKSSGGPAGSGMPMGDHAGSERVKTLQKALQDKGIDPGPIDGILGPKTQAALRSFQKDQKLPETGRMDNDTLAKLGVSK